MDRFTHPFHDRWKIDHSSNEKRGIIPRAAARAHPGTSLDIPWEESDIYCRMIHTWEAFVETDFIVDRRSFLKIGFFSSLSLAFKPFEGSIPGSAFSLGRIATSWLQSYVEPSFDSRIQEKLFRDELLTLLARIKVDDGPSHNRIWYQTPAGYVHSANMQLVRWEPQVPLASIPKDGALFEISVPFTRTYRYADPNSIPYYRLYYQSTAWVTDCVRGVDGRYWYQLRDDLLGVRYYARAEHLRWIKPEELSPLSPHIINREKRIEVDLAQQELRAFEREQLVMRTRISSGIPNSKPGPNGIPTKTPSGQFYITRKTPLRHMGDGNLTADMEAYELPGVPWCSFFHITGVAFHGTYWHTDFGRPRSHGCVNMRTEEALWVYRWTTPVVPADQMLEHGQGTRVIVR